MRIIRALATEVSGDGRFITDDEAKFAREFGVPCSKRCWLTPDYPGNSGRAFLWRPEYGKGKTSGIIYRRLAHGIIFELRRIK